MKIDVEGAEGRALLGLESLLDAGRPDLEVVVEIVPGVLRNEPLTAEGIFDLFSKHGFHAYRIANDYTASEYLEVEARSRPERVDEIPAGREQSDLVFSRIDAKHL